MKNQGSLDGPENPRLPSSSTPDSFRTCLTGGLFHKLKFEANFRRSDLERSRKTRTVRDGLVPGPLLEMTLDDLFIQISSDVPWTCMFSSNRQMLRKACRSSIANRLGSEILFTSYIILKSRNSTEFVCLVTSLSSEN